MNLRKGFTFALIISLILCLTAPTGVKAGPVMQASNSLKVDQVEGGLGDTVSVAVYATPQDFIEAYRVSVQFDTYAVELVNGQEVTDELGTSGTESFHTDFSTPGIVNVEVKNLSDHVIMDADTKIFTMHFKIKSDADPGIKPLQIVQHDLHEGGILANTSTQSGSITIKAPLIKRYTVNFDSNGGSAVPSVTDITYGSKIDSPTMPTQAGYTFIGWYRDQDGTQAWDFNQNTVVDNTTLYAQWTKHAVQLQLSSMSGARGTTIQVPVQVLGTAAGIAAYDIPLTFDPNTFEVTAIENKSGDLFDSNFDNADGWLKAVWADQNAGNSPIGQGSTLFTISFKIKQDAVLGKYDIKPDNKNLLVSDSSATPMDSALKAATITVEKEVPQYTVDFNTQEGSVVESLSHVVAGTTISAPQAPVKSGYTFAGWYKDMDGSQAWNFATDVVNANLTLYAKWTVKSSSNSGSSSSSGGSGGSGAPTTPVVSTNPPSTAQPGLQLIVNGVVKEQVGTGTLTTVAGKSIFTAVVDPTKLKEQLQQVGNRTSIIVPINQNNDQASVELTGDVVKAMEGKQSLLEIRSPNGSYKLPAEQMVIDQLSRKLGDAINLKDIVIHVNITKKDTNDMQKAQSVAAQNGYSIVAPTISFEVTASYNGKTVQVDQFNQYVEREIPLPEGIDPSKVTTAVVQNADGTVRHVPTFITSRDGKYYAVINSLTNSDYSLIWHPKTFADVSGKWSEQAVNNMASRMIVNGVDADHYNPNADVTRAELASILVRALGLPTNSGNATFNDVTANDWYAGAVAKAADYGLIQGYADGSFGPDRTITRQEALMMLTRAMKIANLNTQTNDAATVLAAYADHASVASWAKDAVATAIQSGLVQGNNQGLAPTQHLSRAETAALVQRLLIQAKLIDEVPTKS